MRLTYEAISDMGLLRRNNEDMALVMQQTVRDDSDRFAFEIPEKGMKFGAIVCDGLGGHDGGEIASETACRSFAGFIETLPDGLEDNELISHIKGWFRQVNDEVMQKMPGSRMGTTLSGIMLYGETALVLNSGDSRTYRLRYGNMTQLTSDHSERLRTGNPDVPPSRIYNCIGVKDAFIDIKITRFIAGDRILICSDGLSDMIPPEQIKDNFENAEALVNAALAAGGYDNVTVIAVGFDESEADC